LEDALRTVNGYRAKNHEIYDTRDSLESSPAFPDDQQALAANVNAPNSDVVENRVCPSTRSVSDGFTATFIRSHVVGHRAIQSSDLALEDIAPEDDIEGSGKDTRGCHVMSMSGKSQSLSVGQDVDLSVDSIDDGMGDGNEGKSDGCVESRPEELGVMERGGKCVGNAMLCEEIGSPDETEINRQAGLVVMATASQPMASLEISQSKKQVSIDMQESFNSHVTDGIAQSTYQIDLGKSSHTTNRCILETDSLDNSLHDQLKSKALVEPTKSTLNANGALKLDKSVNGKPDSSEKITPERIRGRDSLFMSSVVMNTPATSAVQAALSQYLVGRSSSMPSCKQAQMNGSKREANKSDEQRNEQPVGMTTKAGEMIDFNGGFKLRETSSEQKLTGILKKPKGKRPNSANGVDKARPVNSSLSDSSKKTVRFADTHHNVKLISPSTVQDSPFVSYVKSKKKRNATALVSQSERQGERSDSFVAQQEATTISGVARKSSQSRGKQTGSPAILKRVLDSKSSGNGMFSVKITGYGRDKRDKPDVEKSHEMESRQETALDQLDQGESISLEKTPTDEEINELWTTVRAQLQPESYNSSVKGLASLRSIILEPRRSSTESLSDSHNATQDTYQVSSRSQLTNRPTMAIPVMSTLDQTIGWDTQRVTSQTPAVSQSQSSPSLSQAVYSESIQAMGRPPAYVRHYQQQAEMALMRGAARAPPTMRSYRFPNKSGELARNGSERSIVRERQSQSTLNGKKPMTELSLEEMQVLKSLERLNSKLEEKQKALQNATGASTITVKTIQPQQRQKVTPSVGAPYQASIHRRALSNMPKTRVRRNPHAVAAAAMAAVHSQNSRTQPHVPIHRQALYNM
jgi:hypothetical protein